MCAYLRVIVETDIQDTSVRFLLEDVQSPIAYVFSLLLITVFLVIRVLSISNQWCVRSYSIPQNVLEFLVP